VDELIKAIGVLMAHPNRDEALKALHENGQPLTQHFVNMGHGLEREASKVKVAEAENAKKAAETQLAEATQTIDQLRKDKPDLAALQTQHQQELAKKDELREKGLEAERKKTRSVLLQRDLEKIKSKMVGKKVDPEIAQTLINDATLHDRFKYDDEGRPTVFQAGTQTPYSVANGQDMLDPFVEELVKRVPKRGFLEDIDEGSEITGHRSDTGGGGKGKKTIFDQIRADTEQANKQADAEDLATRRGKKFGVGS
jgi:hypothetical protein